MRRQLVPILIVAVLAATGFIAIALRSGHHTPIGQESAAQSGSAAEAPAPEQTPAAAQPEPAAKDRPSSTAAPATKPAQTKAVDTGQPQRPSQGGNSPRTAGREYTMQLMRLVMNITEIEKSEKHALTLAQAKQVLAVLKPLRSKPKLTDEAAGLALRSLKRVLTADQLNAMTRLAPGPAGGRPGQGGPPPGAPGQGPPPPGQDGMGPGGPGAPPPGADGQRRPGPRMMVDFNPFRAGAPEGDERAGEMRKRMNDFFADLEKKAAAK